MDFKISLFRRLYISMLILFTTNTFSQCFEIQSILVDACNGTAEGLNEMVRFKLNNSPLDINTLTVVWPNNSWQGIVQNAATASVVAQLNTDITNAGGCGQILEPPEGIIPANATVILVTSYNMNTSVNSFGPLSETLYMIFQNAVNPIGHFSNYTNVPPNDRTFSMSFGVGCSDLVVYNKSLLIKQNGTPGAEDGATVDFTPTGIASYSNFGCKAPTPPFTVDAGPLNMNVCAGATISLNGVAVGQQSLLWSSPSGVFSSSVTASTDYTIPTTAGGTTIILTLEAINNCSLKITDAINLSVAANTIPSFATTITLCALDIPPPLNPISPNGITGTWSPTVIGTTNSGNYTFTPDAGQCATSVILAVTITPETIPDFATNLTLCALDIPPALNTTSPNGITGIWNPTVISTISSGNYTFTPDAGQCATPVTLTVTITPETIPNFATTLTLCTLDTPPPLTNISPNGITGTWTPAIISIANSSNYTFTPDAGQCATSVILAVTITPETIPNFATTLTLCALDIPPLLTNISPNGITGTWNPAIISIANSGNYTFNPDAGQCATTIILAVTITPETIPDFATTLTFCALDTPPTLTNISPNGITGTWTPIVISTTNSDNYTFIPDAGQCATTIILAVTITPETIPNFATALALCTLDTPPILTTTSPNGITGTWTPGVISTISSGNYTFTPDAGQCSVPVTLAVTITPETIPNFDTTLTLCALDTPPPLTNLSPNGITGTWNPAVIGTISNSNYTFTPDVGQCATPVTLAVMITPEVIPNFPTTLTLCVLDNPPSLTNISPNGITGTWNPIVISTTNSDNYTFISDAGQCAATTTLAVTITPEVTPDFATTLTLCNSTPAPILATTSPNGITGTWSPAVVSTTTDAIYVFTPDNGQCARIATLAVITMPDVTPDFVTTLNLCGTDTAPVLATTSPNGITGSWSPAVISTANSRNYIFTPTAGQCAKTTTLFVTITTAAIPDFINMLTLCKGDTVPALASTSPNGISGIWNPAVINTATSGNYTFTPNMGLCARAITLSVNISTVDYSITQDCINNKYLIKVMPNSNFASSDYRYRWINDKGVQVGYDTIFDFTEYIETLNDKPTLPLQFKVIVGYGSCETEETFSITDNLCGIPNAISPNGDGVNDNLDLIFFNVNDLTIFNRYGREIYHFSGKYENQWHGQWKDGRLPMGTYFYIISSENGERRAGWIFLVY